MACPQCGQEAKQVGKVFFCMTLDCPVCMVKGEEQGDNPTEKEDQ
jgi:hypothetical protein